MRYLKSVGRLIGSVTFLAVFEAGTATADVDEQKAQEIAEWFVTKNAFDERIVEHYNQNAPDLVYEYDYTFDVCDIEVTVTNVNFPNESWYKYTRTVNASLFEDKGVILFKGNNNNRMVRFPCIDNDYCFSSTSEKSNGTKNPNTQRWRYLDLPLGSLQGTTSDRVLEGVKAYIGACGGKVEPPDPF